MQRWKENLNLSSAFQDLKGFVVEHRLEERSIEGFYMCVREYQTTSECQELLGELEEDQFSVTVSKVSLTLAEWPTCGYQYVTVYIPVIYKGREIGMYRAIFNVAGMYEDDYFRIDPVLI